MIPVERVHHLEVELVDEGQVLVLPGDTFGTVAIDLDAEAVDRLEVVRNESLLVDGRAVDVRGVFVHVLEDWLVADEPVPEGVA